MLLTFWHSGGDIIWRGDGRCTPIERCQAEGLRDIYGDEADAAVMADTDDEPAHRLFLEISKAILAQDRWRRVTNPTRKAA